MRINFSEFHPLEVTVLLGKEQNDVLSIAYDSREVKEASAFFCVRGEQCDGHDFIEEAISKGATVIVGSSYSSLYNYSQKYPYTTFLVVDDVRKMLALFSICLHKQVHEQLTTIAVTGTNGKTTTTSYIHSLLNKMNIPAGSIGTAGVCGREKELDIDRTTPTTPEAPDLHECFSRFVNEGNKAVVMEATSIAVEQKRLEGIFFDIGVHTNLTPEHLEFHKTYENYKKAKLKLFHQVHKAVINLDDDGMAADLLASFTGRYLTYGLEKEADVSAHHIRTVKGGTSFELRMNGLAKQMTVPIFGKYNISNLLAAICVFLHMGIKARKIFQSIPFVEGAEGRFQLLTDYDDYQIILDYAHTPDALDKLLQAVESMSYNRLIVMITGIGLRDPGKRPKMANVIEGRADEIVVAVDQPGFVDRKKIVADVMKGFKYPINPHIHQELYRETGIHKALSLGQPGDLVVLTGIGFGGYQIVEGEKIPYSELEVINDYYHSKRELLVAED